MFVVFNWCRPKLILFEVFVKSSSQLVYVECIVYALDITSVVVGAGTNVSPRTKTPRWLPDSRVLPPPQGNAKYAAASNLPGESVCIVLHTQMGSNQSVPARDRSDDEKTST